MLPAATLVHEGAARLRLRISSRKKDQAYFDRVRAVLEDCPGVGEVSVNPLTGSVLILHINATPQILSYAEENGLFQIPEGSARKRTYPNAVSQTFTDMDSRVQRLSGGDLNLPSAISAGLLLTGIFQIARGNFAAPAWYTAFWYGSNVFLKARDNQSGEGATGSPEQGGSDE